MSQLQAFLQARASPSFALPSAPSEPVSIAWAGPLNGSTTTATTLPNGTIYPLSGPFIGGPLHGSLAATLAGNPTIDGFPCLGVVKDYTCKGQPRIRTSSTILRFQTDAAVLELAGVAPDQSPDGAAIALMVDGQLVPTKILSSSRAVGGWNIGSMRVDFGTSGLRDLWIQVSNFYPAYVKVGQNDSVFATDSSAEPQMTVIGDSYLQVGSADFAGAGIALETGARLGIGNISVDGIGGTGYWNSGGNVGNLNDRLPVDVTDNSTIYLVLAGLNDYGDYINPPPEIVWPSTATFENAVLGYLQNLRAAQPNALIVVTSPFCPVPPMSDSSYVASSVTNTSGLGDFLWMAQLHLSSLQQIAGPWVYIDVLMGGGWLNSSGATGDITNLQWFTGGTPAPGTTATNKPGNTLGGGGGGFGGISSVPVVAGGQYTQAPDVFVSGGSGSGLALASEINSSGAITSLTVICPGSYYTSGAGLPTISVDPTYQVSAATFGTPVLMVGENPNGEYPLPPFAPPGVSGDLNNIYVMLLPDETHPSPVGVPYVSTRLAQNIYDAVMAL
jgi:hypothetical protein